MNQQTNTWILERKLQLGCIITTLSSSIHLFHDEN
jgi:hypothetical protein